MRQNAPIYVVQSIDKAFQLLELLAAAGSHAFTLPMLAEQLELSRNKTFRIAATLQERYLIERDSGGHYRLGVAAMELSQRVLNNSSVIGHAHVVMTGLARKHQEAVYLTVLQGEEVLFLDMVDCEQEVRTAPLIGKRFPFFSNAAGKAIKALDSRDLLEKVFRKGRRRGGMPDFANFEAELADIRRRGVAVDRGGLGEGICSVAVAVRDYAGTVIGAITLLGPSFRLLAERLESEIIPSLQEGAAILSGKFGYAPL
jgi:DNA-binding IclR family transcriptional regulator